MNQNIRSKILIVDDDTANLKILRDALEPEGYRILVASDGQMALRTATKALPDLILLDIVMPGMDGYEVCRQLKRNEATQHLPVIFITVRDEKESLVQAFQVGGVDYITKPVEQEEVLIRVENHLKISHLTRELLQRNRELQEEIEKRQQAEKAQQEAENALHKSDEHLSLISEREARRWGIASLIGKSKTMGQILDDIRRLHETGATNVLITGESGTGKELIARAIHFGGPRAQGPFIAVNCSAIPYELAESLCFGHVKGAFTGATTDRKGYFELADGGTLFLDEIGDMPSDLQVKLLRVIEEGCIMPLGARKPKRVDVRLLAAANVDLYKKVAEGKFRSDLYYRLAVFPVVVPPLRERAEDIPLLTEHFLALFAEEMGIANPALSPEALSALEAYHFPGNVRELKNMIEHALIKSGGSVIQLEHLIFFDPSPTAAVIESPASAGKPQSPADVLEVPLDLAAAEDKLIEYALEQSGDNIAAAARMINTNRPKIYRYLLKKGRSTPQAD